MEEDLSKGILETIDMDSYRVEKRAMREIMLEDDDAEIEPVPGVGGAGKGEAEIDRLSAIIEQFNDLFGGIDWQHADRVSQMITETIPAKVAEGHGLQERPGELGQRERPDRARQGPRASDDEHHEGRHGAVQAVRRQHRFQALARRHRVPASLRGSGYKLKGASQHELNASARADDLGDQSRRKLSQ